jgi:hypothetical protein
MIAKFDSGRVVGLIDDDGRTMIFCSCCDRGGRGNAQDKCSCGWKVTEGEALGCYLGTPIVGQPKQPPKLTRSLKRYQKYLDSEYGGSFREYMGFDLKKKARSA